jgi:hypothetical protein
MAVVLVEGFDVYNGISSSGTNIGLNSSWSLISNGTGHSLLNGRFGGQSYSVVTTFSPGIQKFFTATSSFTVGFALYVPSLPNTLNTDGDCFINLKSGLTFMVGLKLINTGALYVQRNTAVATGTSLGNTAAGVITAATWHYIELSCTISDTLGTVNLRVNGQSVLSLTNQDTRNGTPTTVDTIQIGALNGGRGGQHIIDDLYVTDSVTPLGEQRIETLYPSADTAQKQLTPVASFDLGANTTVSTTAYATKGDIFTATANATLAAVTVYFGAVQQYVKLGVAQLSSANPGVVSSVLYESSVLNWSGSAAANYTFNVPGIALTSGNVYAIYFTRTEGSNTSIMSLPFPGTIPPNLDPTSTLTWNGAVRLDDNNIGSGDSLFFSNTAYVPIILGLTKESGSNNYGTVDETLMNNTDYVYSNTVGNYDLYDFGNLSSTPNTISAVQVGVLAQKDNVGTRAVAPVLKSGSTTVDGANTYLAGGFTVTEQLYNTDPNTGGAWSAGSVNALQAGVKVTI